MKKVLAALCAAVMVLASTVTAIAAPSAGADKVEMAGVSALKSAMSCEDKNVSMQTVTDAVAKEAQAEVVKILQANTEKVKAKILALANVSFPEGKTSGTIKFAVTGVYSTDSTDTIVVLHQKKDGSWEKITPSAVEKGYVTAYFNSLSPVAIVKVIPEAGKFGVGFSTLALVAAAGLAGAVVCGKKKSN